MNSDKLKVVLPQIVHFFPSHFKLEHMNFITRGNIECMPYSDKKSHFAEKRLLFWLTTPHLSQFPFNPIISM